MPGKRTCHQLKSTNSREYLKFAIIFALEITKIGITELVFQPNFFLSTLYKFCPPPPYRRKEFLARQGLEHGTSRPTNQISIFRTHGAVSQCLSLYPHFPFPNQVHSNYRFPFLAAFLPMFPMFPIPFSIAFSFYLYVFQSALI